MLFALSLSPASCPSLVHRHSLFSASAPALSPPKYLSLPFLFFSWFPHHLFLLWTLARYEAAPWVSWNSTWRLTPSPWTSSSWSPAMSSCSWSSSSPASCTTAGAKTPLRSTPPTTRRRHPASRPSAWWSCRTHPPRPATSPTTRPATASCPRQTWAGTEERGSGKERGRGRRGVLWSEEEEEKGRPWGADVSLWTVFLVLDSHFYFSWMVVSCWDAQQEVSSQQGRPGSFQSQLKTFITQLQKPSTQTLITWTW